MSIYDIGFIAIKKRSLSALEYASLALGFLVPLLTNMKFEFISRGDFLQILGTLMSVNGSILGLVIAGFSISNAIPKDTLVFMVANESNKPGRSYFKVMIDNYAVCFFALFTSVAFFIIIYFVSFMDVPPIFSQEAIVITNSVLFGSICLMQIWVLVELKKFLFWIYDNALMVAQAAAANEGEVPFDKD